MIRVHCAGLAALVLLVAPAAQAAKSYDNCTGFIDSVPATISTQGTWCLRKDLATALTSGAAITIATNNVTVDCNDFKLGGLAAGLATQTVGINGPDRFNATIRHCNVRGFFRGIYLSGSLSSSGGHVVEDNRLDNNTRTGILVAGEGSQVRRNLVRDTGGSNAPASAGTAWGIYASGNVDVYDNVISGVAPAADGGGAATSYGLYLISGSGASATNNRVRGITSLGSGISRGIAVASSNFATLRDNLVVGPGSVGIHCLSTDTGIQGNTMLNFTTSWATCVDDGGNVVH